ncbi:unnamed protein product [Sphagnum balticum]
MSRLSFRPRPLDIYKKLPIVKSGKDLDGDDIASVSKNLPSSSNGVDADNELSGFGDDGERIGALNYCNKKRRVEHLLGICCESLSSSAHAAVMIR